MNCPTCGHASVANGTRQSGLPRLGDDGRIVVSERTVARRLCRGCGAAFAVPDLPLALLRDRVRDLVVERGMKGAADTLGCEERSIRRHLRGWIAARESDVPAYRPRVVGLATFKAGGRSSTMIVDADNEALFDICRCPDGTQAWLESRPGVVTKAVVDFDPGNRKILQEALPDVVIAVPPVIASRAIRAAAITAARRHIALFRDGRNYRERANLVVRPDATITSEERDEIDSFWSPGLRTLRRVTLKMIDALATGIQTAAAIQTAIDFLDRWDPASRLRHLIAVWADPIVAGAGDQSLDVLWSKIGTLIADARESLAKAGLEVLRAALVFAPVRQGLDGGACLNDLMGSAGRIHAPG